MRKYHLYIIAGFIVFIFVLVSFSLTDLRIESFENIQFRMFIYENSSSPTQTENLEKLLQAYHYPYEIVGKDESWKGWYGRYLAYHKYIDSIEDPETYVLLTDGRDVLINEDFESFIEKAVRMYEANGSAIIFTSETNCCMIGEEYAGDDREGQIEKMKKYFEDVSPKESKSPFIYLNYGIIFGKCKDFKKMYEIMDMKSGYDDQGTVVLRIQEGKFRDFTLDYNHDIFSTLIGDEHPEWDESTHRYFNSTTETYPAILHFAGKNKHYNDCVKKLFEVNKISSEPIYI